MSREIANEKNGENIAAKINGEFYPAGNFTSVEVTDGGVFRFKKEEGEIYVTGNISVTVWAKNASRR
ncbi:MAG: hypothetical protein AB1553_04535 [Nitrospirota bacterium]